MLLSAFVMTVVLYGLLAWPLMYFAALCSPVIWKFSQLLVPLWLWLDGAVPDPTSALFALFDIVGIESWLHGSEFLTLTTVVDAQTQSVTKITFNLFSRDRLVFMMLQNPKLLILGKSTTADVCYFCNQRVYIVERYTLRGILFHRNCLRCDYCGAVLRVSSYACETLDNGQSTCFSGVFISSRMRGGAWRYAGGAWSEVVTEGLSDSTSVQGGSCGPWEMGSVV